MLATIDSQNLEQNRTSISSRELKNSFDTKIEMQLRPSRRSAHLDSAGEILCFATAQQTTTRNSTFDIFHEIWGDDWGLRKHTTSSRKFDISNLTCLRSCTTPPAASLSNLEFDTRFFSFFFFFPFCDAATRRTLQHCRKSDPMENFDCTQEKC